MSHDSKLPKTNSPLPSINYKQCISLVLLLLVTSSIAQSPVATYDCPSGCECNETTFSARCDGLDGLIASYSQKQHKSRQNFMPIKSLDLSNNQLSKLTSQLEVLVNLTELNLSHNQLTQVHKLNFASLETLDLSHNRITSAKLKKLPKNVVHLNLANNEITYLPVDIMKLKKLRSLELSGNPLNCTCNTLHVRNWITFQHVWSTEKILCSAPAFVKGQPWLQVRQNDICMETSTTTTQRSKYNWDNYEDDQNNMLGDDPNVDNDEQPQDDEVNYDDDEETVEKADADEETINEEEKQDDVKTEAEEKSDDEAAKSDAEEDVFADVPKSSKTHEEEKMQDEKADDDDFIPVVQTTEAPEASSIAPEYVSELIVNPEDLYDQDDEGSGSDISAVTTVEPQEDEDGSGSGAGILDIAITDDLSKEGTGKLPDIGIFEDKAEEELIANRAPVDEVNKETEPVIDGNSAQTGEVKTASQDNNTGTYVLLGILAVCLISLMAFVAMKNRKEKKRNRHYDVERIGATELQDMDKSLLGKPIDRNGNGNAKPEQSPLINDYVPALDTKPRNLSSFQAPEITVDEPKAAPRDKEKSQQSLYENIPNGNGHVEPVHNNPSNGGFARSPDSDDEIFHPANDTPISPESLNVSPEPPKRYSPIYSSASPRSDRYSPVYSPDGRVKIKLTETPKPKTPVVVTRSRSRAGDYINTPNV